MTILSGSDKFCCTDKDSQNNLTFTESCFKESNESCGKMCLEDLLIPINESNYSKFKLKSLEKKFLSKNNISLIRVLNNKKIYYRFLNDLKDFRETINYEMNYSFSSINLQDEKIKFVFNFNFLPYKLTNTVTWNNFENSAYNENGDSWNNINFSWNDFRYHRINNLTQFPEKLNIQKEFSIYLDEQSQIAQNTVETTFELDFFNYKLKFLIIYNKLTENLSIEVIESSIEKNYFSSKIYQKNTELDYSVSGTELIGTGKHLLFSQSAIFYNLLNSFLFVSHDNEMNYIELFNSDLEEKELKIAQYN
jgi:hypothetical protein